MRSTYLKEKGKGLCYSKYIDVTKDNKIKKC